MGHFCRCKTRADVHVGKASETTLGHRQAETCGWACWRVRGAATAEARSMGCPQLQGLGLQVLVKGLCILGVQRAEYHQTDTHAPLRGARKSTFQHTETQEDKLLSSAVPLQYSLNRILLEAS